MRKKSSTFVLPGLFGLLQIVEIIHFLKEKWRAGKASNALNHPKTPGLDLTHVSRKIHRNFRYLSPITKASYGDVKITRVHQGSQKKVLLAVLLNCDDPPYLRMT